MSNESTIQSLLNTVVFDDPRLFQLLDYLVSDFYALNNQVNPPSSQFVFGVTGQIVSPSNVSGFTATLFSNNLRLTWNAISGISNYEIRYNFGVSTDWDTASLILRTSTLSADINPLTVPLIVGHHTFLIKAVNNNGVYSDTAFSVTINIPQITAPVITPTVINNNVLLNWTVPSSVLQIDHYKIYKNGVLQGRVSGTFEAIFETSGGTYTYIVEPVDIVGNVGEPSTGVVLSISDPSDYTLHDVITSILNGTKTNCKTENVAGVDYLLACIDITETYENHFINNSWDTPQEQIDANYPIYIQPSETTGEYIEVFDFGAIISNLISVVDWNKIDVVDGVTVLTSTLETSTDGSTWSTPVTGSSIFAASLRYVRLKLKFVAATDKALAYFYNIRCLINVHREQDGGVQACLAADAGGTVVTFNKAFKAIDTITLSPVSTVERKAVYDFAFPINPTTFKILLFNAAGARVDGDVGWIARGIF